MFTLKVTLTLVAFAIFITFLVVCCYFTNLLDKLLGWAIVEVDEENGLRRGFNFVFFITVLAFKIPKGGYHAASTANYRAYHEQVLERVMLAGKAKG